MGGSPPFTSKYYDSRFRLRCCPWRETPNKLQPLRNQFFVLSLSSCAKAPVSQLVEETASKSVQCGFESHRGHRIDEQPWLEFPAAAFVIRSPYAGPVGTVFFDSDGEPVAGVAGAPPVTPRMCELLPDAVRLRRPRHCCWIGMVFDVRLLSAMSFVYSYK